MATITSIGTDDNIERLGSCTAGMTQSRIRVPVQNLELGMRVDELDKPWLESSFLFQGFFIDSDAQITALQDECKFVYVTVTRQASALKQKSTKRMPRKSLFDWSSAENKQHNR